MCTHVMDSKGRHAQGCKASLPSDEAGTGAGKRQKVDDLRLPSDSRIQSIRWRLDFRLEVCPPATVITHAAGSFGCVTITWRRSVSKSLV